MTPADLAREITTRGAAMDRFIVGVAGPPGAGKSTIAGAIASAIGAGARVVPMDGFHLDNAVLDKLGLRARKGAPETFDALGFVHLMQRLRRGGDGIFVGWPAAGCCRCAGGCVWVKGCDP